MVIETTRAPTAETDGDLNATASFQPRTSSWPTPFTPSFAPSGRFSGLSENMQFDVQAAELLLSLHPVAAEWWVENCIRLNKQLGAAEGTEINLGKMNFQMYSPFKLTSSSPMLEEAAQKFGLELAPNKEQKSGEVIFIVKDPTLLKLQPDIDFVQPPTTPLNIKLLPDVSTEDSSIRVEQVATMTQQSSQAVRDWESLDDAQQVQSRVGDYNRFITEPTVENLVEATKNPVKRDAYFLAMKYLSQHEADPLLTSIIHVAFDIHHTRFGAMRCNEPYEKMTGKDKFVLATLIDKLRSDCE